MIALTEIKSCLADGTYGGVPSVSKSVHNGVTAYTVRAVSEHGCLHGDRAVVTEITPDGEADGCMAIVLYAVWCVPEFPASFGEVKENTQMLLWKKKNGGYSCILPLVSGDYVTMLQSVDGKLCAITKSFCDSLKTCESTAFLYGEGDQPHELVHTMAKEAAYVLNNGVMLREDRRYPEVFEYLGWCSWDSMEIWVNEAEIIQKCREFKDKHIPIRWGVLDDMWADVEWTKKLPKFTPHDISFKVMHSSKLRDYEADPERFPEGLAHTVRAMKEDFGWKVGVWHPTAGYWAGLVKDGPAYEKLKDYTMQVKFGERILPDLRDARQAFGYYNTIHTFLRACGTDFLKIDNQSFVRAHYANDVPVGIAAANLHAGLEASVGAHFCGDLINCMGMATENMLNRTASAVSRCSGDFQPENRAWFSSHLMACAYNGLLQGQFYYNDWDMWWSDDEQALKNSVLRALSGGPVYVSDRLDRSRAEIFKPLCFSDGRLLRPDLSAMPTADCVVTDMTKAEKPLKVFNIAGKVGYIAAFNLHHKEECSVSGSISAADIPGLAGEKFLLHEYFSGAWTLLGKEDVYSFTLKDADDFRLYALVPVENGMAILGDTEKFISSRAVSDSARGFIRTVEGGKIRFYSEKKITRAENAAGDVLPLECDGDLYTVYAKADEKELYIL